jgi:putative transposase
VAGLIAMQRDSRTRLYHRLRTHREDKSERRSMSEWDFIADRRRAPAGHGDDA